MSEVIKLYENAGIKPDCTYLFLVGGNGENEAARTISIGSKADLKRLIVDCGVKGRVIKSTNTLKPFYPLFTAEKQIELTRKLWEFRPNIYPNFDLLVKHSYGEMIATFVNNHWQDLTEEKRKQIKRILK